MTDARRTLELVCPAGTPAGLKAAVEAGADVVYIGFRDETNARNFPGLNFSRDEAREAIAFAHGRGAEVYIAINTYPRAGDDRPWPAAVDDAARIRADAVILADIGLLDYAARTHPDLRRHLSVQASASHAQSINFYARNFGVRRVVLPRVLTVPEIAALMPAIDVETEVFAFGGMCPMAEGRCSLSSYVTGQSPNMNGVCSPAAFVRYEERREGLVSLLNGSVINVFEKHEAAGYPTLCKGRFRVGDSAGYLFEEPTSLSVAEIVKDLMTAGVTALKIEGRQRGKAYIAEVVSAFRKVVDAAARDLPPPAGEVAKLRRLTEGQTETTGAYKKNWR
ncbi:MAG: U32 family peptidase [Sphingomonadales bacterium]|nr:U32 family peptidase [Sphingomonadales bacterium]